MPRAGVAMSRSQADVLLKGHQDMLLRSTTRSSTSGLLTGADVSLGKGIDTVPALMNIC